MHFFKLTNCIFQGSTVSRAASDKEKAKELPTLKDNDFLDQNIKLKLPGEVRQQLLDMLGSDTEWPSKVEYRFLLQRLLLSSILQGHLMDYSLLLGIHDCERAAAEAANRPIEQTSEVNLVFN